MSSQLWVSDAGTGPTALVIHGGGTHGPLWASDLHALTATHRIIVPTRRGYPGSPASPQDWTAHSEDMVAVLDAAGVERAAVVAHSAGCIVALDLAVRHPERVTRLALLDPGVRLRSFATPAFLRAFVKAQVARRFRGEQRAIAGWFRYALSYRTGGTAWDRLPEERRAALRANANGVFADFASGDGAGLIDDERLGRITLPVTVVIADETPATLRRSGEHLAATIPGAERIVVQNAGHALAFDAHAELLSILATALRSDSQTHPAP